LDIVWALWNFLLTIYWAGQVVTLGKTKKSIGPARAMCLSNLIEGVFFILKVIYDVKAIADVVYPWGLALQMFNGVNIWLMAFYWSRIRSPVSTQDVVKRASVLLVIAMVFAASIVGIMNSYGTNVRGLDFVKPMFLAWFEPPQVLSIAFMIAASSGFSSPCNPPAIAFAGAAILFAAHIASMYVGGSKPCKLESFYVAYIPLQLLGSAVGTLGLTKCLQAGVFEWNITDQDVVLACATDEDGNTLSIASLAQKRIKAEEDVLAGKTQPTLTLSPEDLYSYGVIFVLIGYVLSGTSMALITKPDLTKDPVYRLYGTFHPCILLDYLPGTLFAQPMFSCGILLSQISMLVALFRVIGYGDAMATMMQAMLFGWYWLISAFFVLVFTFNPTMTKGAPVVLHSVPYMIMNMANAFFVLTTIVTMCRWKRLNGKAATSMVGTLYILAIVYGTYFMSGKLMSKHGMNLIECGDLDSDCAKKEVPDAEVKFDPTPMVITLIGQAVILSFGMMSPLRWRPLAFELLSRETNTPSKYVADPDSQQVGDTNASQPPTPSTLARFGIEKFKLKARWPMRILVICMCASIQAAKVMDQRIWGENEVQETHLGVTFASREADYSVIFRRHPGSLIMAVSFVMSASFLIAHVFIAAWHEWKTNDNAALKYWLPFSGVGFLACALVAHAGTIPSGTMGQSTDWFKGVEVFFVAFGVWVWTDAILCLQVLMRTFGEADDEEEEEEEDQGIYVKAILGIQILVGLITGLLLVLTAFHRTQKTDRLIGASLLVWSFLDARGVQIICSGMRVAAPMDMMTWYKQGKKWILPAGYVGSISTGYKLEEETIRADYSTYGKMNQQAEDDDEES